MAHRPLVEGDPKRLGAYEVRARLGEGGHGVVYLARRRGRAAGRDRRDRELVAVKRLRPELAANPELRSRFAREAAAAKQVTGGYTAKVLEAEVAGDRPYIVSEYIEGPTLQQLVADKGPRPESGLLSLAFGTARALAAIHEAGIVHRDFKPNNVVMSPDGPRVIDFGVARSLDATTTLTGHIIGTPAYMAPEQVKGEEITPKTDVFAWAATISFAASGRPPFGADSREPVFYRIINSEPDLAELPAELRDLVLACLAKDPGDRPATPDLLRRLLGGGEVAASAERTPERMVARQAVAVGGEPVVTIKDVPGPVDLLPDAPPVNVETAARRPPPTKRPGPKNDRPVASLVLSALAVAGLITGVAILFGVNDGHGLGDLRAIGDKPHIVPGQSMCAQGGCAQGRSSLRYTLGADRSIATTFQIPGDKTRFFDTELDVIKPAAACGRSVTVRYHAYADYHTGAYDYRRLLDMGDVTRHRDVAEVPLGRATTLHFTAALTAPPPGCTVTLELSNPVIHSLRWMA